MTRRSFLGHSAVGAVAATALVGSGVAVGGALLVGLPRASFATERAFVGDDVPIQVRLATVGLQFASPEAAVQLRITGPEGFRTTLDVPLPSGATTVHWRVPLEAVPGVPGIHPLRLEARRSAGGRWLAAPAPLEVLINRFAFGL